MTRKIIQMFTTVDGDNAALADDGTTWWWRGPQRGLTGGWQPLFEALPQDPPPDVHIVGVRSSWKPEGLDYPLFIVTGTNARLLHEDDKRWGFDFDGGTLVEATNAGSAIWIANNPTAAGIEKREVILGALRRYYLTNTVPF